MSPNPCGGVGIVFAIAAAAVSFVQVTRREFVEVFIPTDVDDKDSGNLKLSCSIAGLGVYTTEYDSTCLDEYTLTNSRVPLEVFEAPTTEFKLLFPAQQNFVAEVLPINAALLQQLDASLGAPIASGLVLAEVQAVEATEFENCDQYVDDAKTNLDALFVKVNDILLPQLIPVLVGGSVENISVAIEAVQQTFSQPAASNLMSQVLQTTFQVIQPFFPLFQIDCPFLSTLELTSAPSAAEFGCIGEVYDFVGVNQTLPFSDTYDRLLIGIGNHISTVCAAIAGIAPGFQLRQCLGSINVQLLDSNLLAPPQFAVVPGITTTLCDVLGGCTTGKLGLLGLITALVNDFISPLGANAPENLLGLLQALNVNLAVGSVFAVPISGTPGTSLDVIGVVSLAAAAQSFPATFTEFYVPCGMLQLAALQAGAAIPGVPAIGTCGFKDFFAGASGVAKAENPDFVPLLEQLVVLYGRCQAAGVSPSACGPFFSGLFLNGAYSFGLDATDVFGAAKDACKDDETDIEKITAAQTILGASVAVYILAVLVGAVGMILPAFNKAVFGVASGMSLLAVVLNILALLQVRSAPVYQSVGQPSVRFSPKYVEGSVVTLAMVSAGLSIAAFFAYLVAVFIHGKCDKVETTVEGKGKSVTNEKIIVVTTAEVVETK